MALHVLALEVELRLAAARSLKDKRQIVTSLLERARNRYGVAAAEIDAQDQHRRAVLGFAVVSSSPHLADEVMDAVEGLVWSRPDAEVVSAQRSWLET